MLWKTIGAMLFGSAAYADAVSNAFLLCALIDGSGLTSSPCEVSGWNSEVVATIDMSAGEARQLCPQLSNVMREKGYDFDGRWTLQIRSPYSGENSIAFCPLH